MIRGLKLWRFRNYGVLDLRLDGRPVALSGPNGSGKTNLLEAVSLLAPGRGLRRAAREDFAQRNGDGSWAVAADVDGRLGPARIGTGVSVEGGERKVRIDGVTARSGTLTDHLGILWLTPAMDSLFVGTPGDRRRFVDRLVLAFDGAHSTRANAFEKALRSRNRLLEDGHSEAGYLSAVEAQVAELGVALAAARLDAVARLSRLIGDGEDAGFPRATVALEGLIEGMLSAGDSAALCEDAYRMLLERGRARDRAAGRTLEGPHRSDLLVTHRAKGLPAAQSSTGEQKALLVGLVLAEARLVTALTGATPLLLLDEVAAHLDPQRRHALHTEIFSLGGQAFLTGADGHLFDSLADAAERFHVADGIVTPIRSSA